MRGSGKPDASTEHDGDVTMTTISQSQEDRVFQEVKRLSHAGLDGTTLLQRVARAVHKTIPFTAYCGATMDPISNLITWGVGEGMDGPAGDAATMSRIFFERVFFEEEYDKIAAMRQAGEVVSSLSTETSGVLERSLRYREMLRPFGFADEINIIFDEKGVWGSLELMREQDARTFSSRELEIVRRIAPHIAAGLKAAAFRAHALDIDIDVTGDGVPGVLVIDAAGRIASATPTAERLLAELGYDGWDWRRSASLPVPVMMVLGVLRRTMQPASDAARHEVPRLRMRSRAGRWLTLHADLIEASWDRPSERVVVIAPAPPQEVAWLTLTAFSLSPREEEVVGLVASGHSTKQIAERLFIAEHTVQRHLTNIFEKVGVRSRRDLVKKVYFATVFPG
jgi:DNA-binding CsgD family transcriptional regulator